MSSSHFVFLVWWKKKQLEWLRAKWIPILFLLIPLSCGNLYLFPAEMGDNIIPTNGWFLQNENWILARLIRLDVVLASCEDVTENFRRSRPNFGGRKRWLPLYLHVNRSPYWWICSHEQKTNITNQWSRNWRCEQVHWMKYYLKDLILVI